MICHRGPATTCRCGLFNNRCLFCNNVPPKCTCPTLKIYNVQNQRVEEIPYRCIPISFRVIARMTPQSTVGINIGAPSTQGIGSASGPLSTQYSGASSSQGSGPLSTQCSGASSSQGSGPHSTQGSEASSSQGSGALSTQCSGASSSEGSGTPSTQGSFIVTIGTEQTPLSGSQGTLTQLMSASSSTTQGSNNVATSMVHGNMSSYHT